MYVPAVSEPVVRNVQFGITKMADSAEEAKYVTQKAVIMVLLEAGAAWAREHPEEAKAEIIGKRVPMGRPVVNYEKFPVPPKPVKPDSELTPEQLAQRELERGMRERAEAARAHAAEIGLNVQD